MDRGGFWGLQRGKEGLKIGHDITADRILPKLLRIATLPPKIAHQALAIPV